MYENCGSEYYDVFMKQFMQTLGQLGAAVVTSALVVPVYSYYSRNFLSSSKNQSVNEVYNTETEFNKNLDESDNITEKDESDNDNTEEDDDRSSDNLIGTE